jgi:hypothetical protein
VIHRWTLIQKLLKRGRRSGGFPSSVSESPQPFESNSWFRNRHPRVFRALVGFEVEEIENSDESEIETWGIETVSQHFGHLRCVVSAKRRSRSSLTCCLILFHSLEQSFIARLIRSSLSPVDMSAIL